MYTHHQPRSNPSQFIAEESLERAKAYLKTSDPKRDLPNARDNLKRAADHGHPEAQYMLASMLRHGRGGEKNEEQALELYLQAAKQGYQPALKRLIMIKDEIDKLLENTNSSEFQQAANGISRRQYEQAATDLRNFLQREIKSAPGELIIGA